jgi:hypothetical protein
LPPEGDHGRHSTIAVLFRVRVGVMVRVSGVRVRFKVGARVVRVRVTFFPHIKKLASGSIHMTLGLGLGIERRLRVSVRLTIKGYGKDLSVSGFSVNG